MPKFGHCHCFLYSYLHFHTMYWPPLSRSTPYPLPAALVQFLYRHHYQRRGELFFHFSYYCKCRRLVEIRQQIMRHSPCHPAPLSDANLVPSTVPITLPFLRHCERGETAAHFRCLLCCCCCCCCRRRRCQRHDVLMSATCSLPFAL